MGCLSRDRRVRSTNVPLGIAEQMLAEEIGLRDGILFQHVRVERDGGGAAEDPMPDLVLHPVQAADRFARLLQLLAPSSETALGQKREVEGRPC